MNATSPRGGGLEGRERSATDTSSATIRRTAESIGNRQPKASRPAKFHTGGNRLSPLKHIAAAAAAHREDKPITLPVVKWLRRPDANGGRQ
jgi:hypothetical protein